MVAENPGPDNDTMETLIDTNEQLGKAMSQHQRAVLNARKVTGLASGTPTPPPVGNSGFEVPPRTESGFAAPPPGPPPGRRKEVPPPVPAGGKQRPVVPPPGDFVQVDPEEENPFTDPTERRAKTQTHNPPFPIDNEPKATGQFNDRLGVEPWHPGFKETQSYVGRQENAVDSTTMHAAVGADVNKPGAIVSDRRRDRRRIDNDDDDDDDGGYMNPPAGGKAPVYRY